MVKGPWFKSWLRLDFSLLFHIYFGIFVSLYVKYAFILTVGNLGVTFYELNSLYGHDTFLLDINGVGAAVKVGTYNLVIADIRIDCQRQFKFDLTISLFFSILKTFGSFCWTLKLRVVFLCILIISV